MNSRFIVCLLTWSAFSSGAVGWNLGRNVPRVLRAPGLLETILSVASVAASAGLFDPAHGMQGFLVALICGATLGALARFIAFRSQRWSSAGSGEFARVESTHQRTAWGKLKSWGQEMADYQARLLITLTYFVAIVPVGLVTQLVRRRPEPGEIATMSHWATRAPGVASIDAARKQF